MDHYGHTVDSTDWLDQCLEPGRKEARPDSSGENEERRDSLSDDGDEKVPLHFDSTPPKPRLGSKPHSTPLTLKWLEENYEIAEGVCIPRSTLYVHYLDYCDKNDTQPVNAASFGKIIRQQFPQITTRRLGTRGQSKYHYYGIGVKETSLYFEVMYSAQGAQGAGDGKKDGTKQIVAYSPRSKLGTLLPEFPDVKDMKIPPNIEEGKVVTFLMMYRTHCQRILDTVIRANFDEVQSFLLHFWQGMPPHMVPILDCGSIVMLVGVCDSILYKAIASVLMPTVLQALPDSLTQVIRRFAKQLDEWLTSALDTLPESLQRIKFDLARRFAQVLRRQTSLNHLCQAARTVIQSSDITVQMLEDWMNIDLNSIVKQTLYTMDQYSEKDHMVIYNLCTEFERLLEEQAPIESYIEWLDSMIDRCVIQPSSKKVGTLRRVARQFLLMWSCFGTRVIRDMTLHSAPSFGSFHLLHLMFDDYVLYLVESLHSQERASEFLRAIKGEETEDLAEEIILPDPTVIKESLIPQTDNSQAMQNQERGSVITNIRSITGHMTGFDDNGNDVTSSSFCQNDRSSNPNKMSIDTGRTRHMSPGAASSTASSIYQACTPYTGQYNQPVAKSSNVQTGSQASYGYDMASTQMLQSGAQLSDETGRPLVMPQGNLRTGTTGADWTQSNQSRQPGGGIGENTPPLIRMNEPSTYPPYPTLRQGALDYTSYAYDPSEKNVPQSIVDNTSYGYHGYAPVGDYYNISDSGNKRRLDDDHYLRAYKRQTKEYFYYEALPSTFAQM